MRKGVVRELYYDNSYYCTNLSYQFTENGEHRERTFEKWGQDSTWGNLSNVKNETIHWSDYDRMEWHTYEDLFNTLI